MADHFSTPNDTSPLTGLQTGAERLRRLLGLVHAEAERQLGEHVDELDTDASIDTRDDERLGKLIELHLPQPGDDAREGFMRALADVLC